MSANVLQAQNVVISLPQANIQNRTDFQQASTTGTYSYPLLAVVPSIHAMSTQGSFSNTIVGNTTTIPLSVIFLKLNQVGITVLSSTTEQQLSNNNTTLLSSLLGITLAKGAVLMNFRVATASQTWIAGNYKTSLRLTAEDLLSASSISPQDRDLTISVPAFMVAPGATGTTSLLVNNLSFYRSANGISNTNTIGTLVSTIPYLPNIRTNNTSQFTFVSGSLPYNTIPIIPVSTVNTSLTGIPTAQTVSLSSTDKILTTTSGLPVPTNNAVSHTYTFSISAAQLKSSFAQAGTYSAPLIYSWNEVPPNTPTHVQANGALEIVVSDLSELVLNQQTVNFAFAATDHYKNGISQDIPGHLTLSKTTPYNLYVRASSSNFSSGTNSIPLDIMQIGPATGETGMNTITLSTTAQKLIESANPVIDRNVGIRYSIPASQTSKLLNKPPGTYSTNVIFSFVAP